MIWLIVARAIQGIGSGSFMGLTQIVISDIVSLQERGKYSGFIGATVSLTLEHSNDSGQSPASWVPSSEELSLNMPPGDGVSS